MDDTREILTKVGKHLLDADNLSDEELKHPLLLHGFFMLFHGLSGHFHAKALINAEPNHEIKTVDDFLRDLDDNTRKN